MLALVTAVVGCGGGSDGERATDETTTTVEAGEPTAEDLDRLSLFLLRDRQAGGADVEIRFASGGEQVELRGVVDWAGHAGSLEVTTTGAGGPAEPYEVRFTEDRVYESLTSADVDRLAAAGRPGLAWSARAPAPAADPLDTILALLVSFAAEQPDNPALVAQRGITVERREAVDGADATVYRTKAEALYWVLDEAGVLARFQGSVDGLEEPVTIDLREHGAREVEVPPAATVVDAAEVAAG